MNRKVLIFSGFLLISIFFVYVLYLLNKNNKNLDLSKNENITPIIKIDEKMTGGLDSELTEEEKNYSDQKMSLLEKLPLETERFSIDFNYAEDRFIVSYKDPKLESKNIFLLWLSKNYPSLKIEEFIEK